MMIRQYFQQAWAQLRQQPLISAVTLAGTELYIFHNMMKEMMHKEKEDHFSTARTRSLIHLLK